MNIRKSNLKKRHDLTPLIERLHAVNEIVGLIKTDPTTTKTLMVVLEELDTIQERLERFNCNLAIV